MPAELNVGEPRREMSIAEEVAVLQLAKRDRRLFEPVYRSYYPRVFAYCRRRLDHPEEAADATSQTFTKALAGIDGFVGGAVAPWIFIIARRVVIDIVRSRRTHADLESVGELAGTTAGPSELAIARDQRRALHAALGRLTPDQREVVELRLAGLTGQEIADVLGMSLPAVKSSQFRAYTRLRALLADEHIFGESP